MNISHTHITHTTCTYHTHACKEQNNLTSVVRKESAKITITFQEYFDVMVMMKAKLATINVS